MTIYIRAMNGVGSSNEREGGATVGIQTVLDTRHCRSFSDLLKWFNIKRKLLSAWQDEHVVDGPRSCVFGGYLQLTLHTTPP